MALASAASPTHDRSPATGNATRSLGCAAWEGFAILGDPFRTCREDRGSPGLESVNRIVDSSKIYNDMVNPKTGTKKICSVF